MFDIYIIQRTVRTMCIFMKQTLIEEIVYKIFPCAFLVVSNILNLCMYSCVYSDQVLEKFTSTK